MKTIFKWFSIFVGVFLLIILSALGYAYWKYPPEKWKEIALSVLEEKLNSDVEIESISYSFDGSLLIENLIIYDRVPQKDENKSKNDYLIKTEKIKIFINPLGLPDKKLQIISVVFDKTDLNILSDKKDAKKLNIERIPFIKNLINEKPSENLVSTKQEKESDIEKKTKEFLTLEEISIDSISLKDFSLNWQASHYYPYKGKYTLNTDIDIDESFFETDSRLNLPDENEEVSVKAKLEFAKEKDMVQYFQNLIEKIIKLDFPRGSCSLSLQNFSPKYLRPFDLYLPLSFIKGDADIVFLGNNKKGLNALQVQTNKIETILINERLPKKPIYISGKYLVEIAKENVESKNFSFSYDEKNSFEGKNLEIKNGNINVIEGQIKSELLFIKEILNLSYDLDGTVKADIFYDKNLKLPEINASFESVDFSMNQMNILEDSAFDFQFKDQKGKIPKSSVTMLNQTVDFSADSKISDSGEINLFFNIKAEELDLVKVLQKEKIAFSWPSSTLYAQNDNAPKTSTLNKFNIEGQVEFNKVKHENIFAQNFKTDVIFSNNILMLNQMQFLLAEGPVKGAYSLKIDNMLHDYKLNIKEIKMHNLLKMFDTEGEIFSKVSGNFEGQMKGLSVKELKNSIISNISLFSTRGKVSNMFFQKGFINGVLGTLEDKIRVMEFDSFEIEISSKEGEIFVRKAKIDSYQYKVMILGKTDWNLTGQMQAVFKFTDTFIQDVANPFALGIIDTKTGNWYNLPFSCEGNMAQASCWRPDW
ncbi:MAG: AsmA family protein [Spirochaetia bacterium]|nr:AsmA family protein [Spirochaetia bacterium]